MGGIDTSEWMATLEAVAQRPPNEANAEWEWLMDQLGLGPEYFLAIYQAVREGRWRKAKDPKAYIKTVARRVAAGMELPTHEDARLVFPAEIEVDGEKVSQEERLDFMQHQYDSAGPSPGVDGVWRGGGKRRDRDNYRDLLMAEVPGELRVVEEPPEELKQFVAEINRRTDEIHIHLKPFIKANWAVWVEAAGLDEWEQEVLRYMLDRVSRRRAMEQQPNEVERRALQAAWRRFERTGRERLAEAAKKISKKMSPNEQKGTLG